MNKVILMGRLTRDPEVRYTQTNNTVVASFSLAVNRRFAKQGEERQADFINIVAWSKLGEFCSKYFKKGQQVGNTVQLQDWDGRYSRRNKEWAKTIPNDNPETVRCGYALNSHPAVLDGFIDLVREEQQRSRTQREKLEPSRPSVRDKLKQELPANKSAAPKKRELER